MLSVATQYPEVHRSVRVKPERWTIPLAGRPRSEIKLELRAAQKRWLDQVRSISGLTLTEIARRADMNPSSLTQFYNKEHRAGTLETLSLRRISDAMGVPVSTDALGEVGGPLNSGFRDIEAEPYQAEMASTIGHAIDVLIDDRDHVHPWTLRSSALELAGYRPGDVLIVDLNGRPSAGDVVCAQFYDWQSGRADTVFRIYEPPFLIAASNDEAYRRPRLVDDNSVAIKGVVETMFRPKKR